ncbi:TPM domain-containing protein [Candidatus Gracilibacteria bacterium]|nr:TPM domain-containing protein [Candidatus Gracilibacteria bacterium]
MKNIFKIIILFLIFGVFNTFGFDIKSLGPINSYVIDQAGVLSKENKTSLETQISNLNQKYTTEILIILLKTLSGEDISSIGTKIGQEIGVGKKDKDNGVVVLIAIDDREWNISTGYGVEGVLPDILTKRLGEKNFILFREGKYFDGISGLLTDFGKAFEGDPSIVSLKSNSISDNQDEGFDIMAIVFAIILSLSFGAIISDNLKQKKYKKIIKYTIIGWIFLLPLFIFSLLTSSIIWFIGTYIGALLGSSAPSSGGGSSGGWGSGSSSRSSWRGSSSSSSGFGGFGGGSFGGGGSSGKW